MTLHGGRELNARLEAIKRSGGRQLSQALGLAAVREQKRLVKRKTGHTARTIRLVRVTATSAETVVAGAGVWLESGTKPHDIYPRFKKALAFPSQQLTSARFGSAARLSFRASGALSSGSVRRFGSAAFAIVRKVRHPGTKAQPFMVPGARAAVKAFGLAARVVKSWNEAA